MRLWKSLDRAQRIFIALCGVFLVAAVIYTLRAEQEDTPMTNLEFFKSLDYEDGLGVVTGTLERFPLQYAATLGLDGEPQLRPIEFKFEEDGVLYFDTVEFYTSYAELQVTHRFLRTTNSPPQKFLLKKTSPGKNIKQLFYWISDLILQNIMCISICLAYRKN